MGVSPPPNSGDPVYSCIKTCAYFLHVELTMFFYLLLFFHCLFAWEGGK